ncbi:hypothetical protein MKX01_035936 [Papaver californicum]|nr:hypothetical protein MKX01_035936 [Papaver californicum]
MDGGTFDEQKLVEKLGGPQLFKEMHSLSITMVQRSREKGPEFVVEFWEVLPVPCWIIEKCPMHLLIGIWEERKVFYIQGKVLKEELLGQNFKRKTVMT